MINITPAKNKILGVVHSAFVSIALLTGTLVSFSIQAQPTTTITYFHNDAAGTPMLATNEAGNVVWKENYRPYGEKVLNQAANSNTTNKIGFAGKPFDNQTGLTYMGARYYDPVIGRFMGVDPVGFQENNIHSFNRYAYANNNPLKYIDPDGKQAVEVGIFNNYMSQQWTQTQQVVGAVFNQSMNTAAQITVGLASFIPVPAAILGRLAVTAKAEATAIELTASQLKNVERFMGKVPANAKDSLVVKALPNEGIAAQAVSPGRVPGSSAVYEKQIDATGKTIQYTKTTYDPAGNIVHVKDKISNGIFP